MNTDDPLILVGRVSGAFGVKGEVRLAAYTADPLALLAYRDLLDGKGQPALSIVSARAAKDGVIARTTEIETREAADAMRGMRLYVPRSALPAPDEDEFYLTDLEGLEVRDRAGAVIGKVRAVQDYGAGDILEVEPAGGGATWLAPFTREVAPVVDVAGGFIVVDRPEETE